PIIAVTSCGATKDEEYSFSGEVYEGGTHKLSSSFIKSLENFKNTKIAYLENKSSLLDDVETAAAIVVGKDFKYPEVTYNFSSLNIDYFSPEIFKYMDFGKVGARINIILKNNNLKSFDFNSVPRIVSSIDLSNNKFTGKLNTSFINKAWPIKINLNNNNLSSIDYDEINKYIKTPNNKTKVSSIVVISDSENPLLWANKGAWFPKRDMFR
ncbi:hypothetical protein, partial [Mycoplasma marinum]